MKQQPSIRTLPLLLNKSDPHWLTNCVDGPMDSLINSWINSLINYWSIDWWTDWLTNWLNGLTDWMNGPLTSDILLLFSWLPSSSFSSFYFFISLFLFLLLFFLASFPTPFHRERGGAVIWTMYSVLYTLYYELYTLYCSLIWFETSSSSAPLLVGLP